MSHHRLAVLGAVIFSGFFISSYIGSPAALVCFAVCGVAAVAARIIFRNNSAVFILTGLTAAFLIYGAYSAVFIDPTAKLFGTRGEVTATVLTVSPPDNDTVHVTCSGRADGIPVKFSLYCRDIGLEPGDTVTAEVKFSEPLVTANYNGDREYAHGIFVRASAENVTVTEKRRGFSVMTAISDYSAYLRDTVRELLPGEEGDLMLAMCFGDRSRMSAGLSDAVTRSGLSHMTAVSGMHISLIVTVLMSLLSLAGAGRLRVVRFSAAAVLSLVLMVFFNMTASVCRSGIMLIAAYGSVLFRRGRSPVDALGAAMLLILLAEPCACRDAGLILSVCGTLGAVSLAPKLGELLRRYRELPGWTDTVLVCVCASYCTLPVSALVFGKLSLVSVLSSLAAAPLFVVIMAFALCTALSGGLLASAVLLPAGALLKAMIAVIRFFAGFRYSCVSIDSDLLVPFAIVSAVFVALAVGIGGSRHRARRAVASAVACAAALTGLVTARKVHDSGITRVVIRSDGKDCIAAVANNSGVSAFCTAVSEKLSSAAYSMLTDLGAQRYDLLCVMEEKKRGTMHSESFDRIEALEKRYLDNSEMLYDICGRYTAEVYEDAVLLAIDGVSVSISDAAAAEVYGGHDIGIYSGYKKSANCYINGVTVMCDKRYPDAEHNAYFSEITLLISPDGRVLIK